MTPASAIAALDRQIGLHGQDIVLRRFSGLGQARTFSDVAIRAIVRDYRPEDIVGGIAQGDISVVLSPTGVAIGGLPKIGDRVVIDGKERVIQAAPPVRIAGRIVRINLQVRG